ncbi:LytR/AlgR family response regulator transcription factor [Paraglaciecola arctica]|uniref:LytR/AlgR family response regulator transcription factor n=1 Tax=Paraglaciecola arctica TaxID=1128911 RepID=UPI001C07370E|nr:LytTR family DNA-binding domain-containing protein [Paraglaciecola arctica]MBU3001896.1 LytTR family DNA-binding domain-containing protein [Paraglaciecola arctica]
MSRLRTLIVDDEPLALKLLRAKLDKVDNIEIVGESKNGREAIAATLELAPDIIFLDIQMPGLNGFDVVKGLQSDILPLIVFTTAYEQYALDAFDVHAVDYILKPIDDERICRAVQRAQKRLDAVDGQDNKPRILGAIDSMSQRIYPQQLENKRLPGALSTDTFMDKKVVIKDRDEITILKQSEIEWVDAAGDYVCLHAEGKTHIKRSTLKELLTELDENIFKRVHRSTIVNLNFIDKVIPHTKGEFFLLLGEFEKIKVSRNYKDAIKDFLLGE